METVHYPSVLLAKAVEQFKALPGVGERTALRFVLHLLKLNKEQGTEFGNAILDLIENLQFCQEWLTISDTDLCNICSSTHSDHGTICVVESVKDVMTIERTHQYSGVYHVLGGVISPVEGVGPSDLTIDKLVDRVNRNKVNEVILAISATMEGETTNFFIHKKLKDLPVKLSVIARGVAFGSNLEYTDEVTLGRSILNRTPFEKS